MKQTNPVFHRQPAVQRKLCGSPAEECRSFPSDTRTPPLLVRERLFYASVRLRFQQIIKPEVKFEMPSEKVMQAKQAKVEALTEQLKNAAACVLVDYKGITVADDTKLRKELREAGVSYSVQKNTLIRLAMHNIGYEQFDSVLEGTTAIAISENDQTAAARILGDFAEKSNGAFSLKAGFVDGEFYDADSVKKLSKIPSKEVLLAQLLGSLQGPMQKLAATLQALVDKKNEEAA